MKLWLTVDADSRKELEAALALLRALEKKARARLAA